MDPPEACAAGSVGPDFSVSAGHTRQGGRPPQRHVPFRQNRPWTTLSL